MRLPRTSVRSPGSPRNTAVGATSTEHLTRLSRYTLSSVCFKSSRIGGAGFDFREQRAHRGQRRLQAVREVVERVAIAREAPPLRVDQRVQVVGEADDLRRITPGQLDALAG